MQAQWSLVRLSRARSVFLPSVRDQHISTISHVSGSTPANPALNTGRGPSVPLFSLDSFSRLTILAIQHVAVA